MAKESPSVEECVAMGLTCAFHNLRRASRAVAQVYDAYFDEMGLKATQFTVLAALLYESNGRPTVTDLATALVLEQSSLSRNLAVLERLGYLKLEPGEDDRRERIVTLTRTGRAALQRGYPVWKAAQRAVDEALADNELDAQIASLRKLTNAALDLRPARPTRSTRPPRTAP